MCWIGTARVLKINPMHRLLPRRSCCHGGPAQSSALPPAKTQPALDLLQQEKGQRGVVCSRTGLSRGFRLWLLAEFVTAPQAAPKICGYPLEAPPQGQAAATGEGLCHHQGSTNTPEELTTCPGQGLDLPTHKASWGK